MKKGFKKLIKGTLILIGVITLIGFVVIKTPLLISDIRPDELKGDYSLTHSGKSYLEKTQIAHGMGQWLNLDSIVFKVDHNIQNGLAKFMLAPDDGSVHHYSLISLPVKRKSSFFRSMSQKDQYIIACDEQGVFKEIGQSQEYGNSSFNFFYYGIRHLIEFPFEMGSADILEHIGEKELKGNSYDLIFATWEKLEPNMEYDQYIIWINKKTGLIDRFDATGRGIMPFAKASVNFEYESLQGGVILPTRIQVNSATSGERPIMYVDVVSQNQY